MRKKIIFIHRWLGIPSGLAVFIIALTGCIYAFKTEIQDLYQPEHIINSKGKEILSPSRFKQIGRTINPNREVHSVNYKGPDTPVELMYYDPKPEIFYRSILCDPFSGKVLELRDHTQDFFYFILQGHFNLWLPRWLGQPIVAYSTLIFFVLCITGLILWWPKNKNARKQRFKIKWKKTTGIKRKLYDLHNVLGFYVLSVALLFSITGLVWGFNWWKEMTYKSLGGEKSLQYEAPAVNNVADMDLKVDLIYRKIESMYPNAAQIDVHFPHAVNSKEARDRMEAIHLSVNHQKETYYHTDYLYFDPNSMEELEVSHLWGRYEDAEMSDKLMRMNYDIHVGSIGGIFGKTLAFLASLIIASLPVTGLFMWWKKRKNAK